MPRPDPPNETWMDAQQYGSLSESDKQAVAAAVEAYDKAVAAAQKQLAEDIALITKGRFDSPD